MKFNRPMHGLRGIASLMVFFAHVTFGFWKHFYNGNAGLSTFVRYFANFGTFGVEIFFIISGFVIVPSCLKYGPLEFFGRRFWRLYPLFAMFTVFYYLMNYFVPQQPGREYISYLISNLLFLDLFLGTNPLTPNAWSITFEVWYYAASYLLIYSVIRRADRFNPILAVVGIAFSGFMIATYDITAYFVGGAFLYYIDRTLMKGRFDIPYKSAWTAVMLLLVIVLTTIWNITPPKTYFEVPGVQLLSFLTLVATLILMLLLMHEDNALSRTLVSKVLRFFGTISYSLYLTHPYTYILVRQIGYKLHLGAHPWEMTLPLYLLANMVLAIGVAWVVHKIVEIGPYRLIYDSRIYRQPDTQMA